LERAVIGYRTRCFRRSTSPCGRASTLGVLGPKRRGQDRFAEALLGCFPCWADGAFFRWPHAAVGYVPQRDRLDMSWPLSVLDVVTDGPCAPWSVR